jgi:hypothetical protein
MIAAIFHDTEHGFALSSIIQVGRFYEQVKWRKMATSGCEVWRKEARKTGGGYGT